MSGDSSNLELSSLAKEDQFISEEVKIFLNKLGLKDAHLVPAIIITANKDTKVQGIYLLKKDEDQLADKNSWLAHMVDSDDATLVRVGKIGKKISAVLDSESEGFSFNNSAKKNFIQSTVLAINGMKYLGELSHGDNKTELYINTKYYVDPSDPNRFVYGVMQSSRERKVPICAPLLQQMAK